MASPAPLPAPAPTFAAAALAYARAGFPVLALRRASKVPATAHGLLDATTELARILEWWRRDPYRNVAISIPAGAVVLDVDDPAALARLAAEGVDLPATVCAETPRGLHFWYTLPAGVVLRPGVGVLGSGVDLRAAGSYVVAPPSIVGGRAYRWRVPLTVDNIAPIPAALLSRLTVRRPSDATPSGERRAAVASLPFFGPRVDVLGLLTRGAPEGERNRTIFRACCSLRRSGGTPEVLREYAEAVAAVCSPPLPIAEARRVAASAARYLPAPEES